MRVTLFSAVLVQAQLEQSHSLGDFVCKLERSPQPAFIQALFYLRTDTDTIKDADRNTVRLSPTLLGASTCRLLLCCGM